MYSSQAETSAFRDNSAGVAKMQQREGHAMGDTELVWQQSLSVRCYANHTLGRTSTIGSLSHIQSQMEEDNHSAKSWWKRVDQANVTQTSQDKGHPQEEKGSRSQNGGKLHSANPGKGTPLQVILLHI